MQVGVAVETGVEVLEGVVVFVGVAVVSGVPVCVVVGVVWGGCVTGRVVDLHSFFL